MRRALPVLLLTFGAPSALAQAPSAPPPAPPAASAVAAPSIGTPCVERVPAGKARPTLKESVPQKGLSGHALTLNFEIVHGKGETVLPSGFQPQSSSKELESMERSGLYLPDPDGGAGPELERSEQGEQATTKVRVSFVPLPDKPGRNELVIPPLPIAIARASGDMIVLCTAPHRVLIEDPIANVPDAKPKENPTARPQLEVWTTAKNAALVALIALVAGALIAWLVGKWLRRPKPVAPPPPPRPPWEVAREELFDLKHAGLLQEQRHAEYFDRVSDTVRKYLGALYGFDGLESTTREALGVLRKVSPRIAILDTIESCLRDADLVKFARVTPSDGDCALAISRAEEIVEATMPATAPAVPPARSAEVTS
ncbi:MAG TPA: hypothetical protein VM686_39735 [Polyangiaceae bacterium]|nr:hypothetical protein [Polyangiaceae bacterium]